jgi:hypothetical protein
MKKKEIMCEREKKIAMEHVRREEKNKKRQQKSVMLILMCLVLLCRDLVAIITLRETWVVVCVCFQMWSALFPPIGPVITLHKNTSTILFFHFFLYCLLCPLQENDDDMSGGG